MRKNVRIVIKIGTKVITSGDKALDKENMEEIVRQVSDIKDKGVDAILVTSGAIGSGMGLLGLKKRPIKLSELQAASSIGQSHLMHLYSECFKARGYLAGQILLTQEDFNNRSRYLNIKYTIQTLLRHGAVPIINENDTVSTVEIRCGDNDTLAGLVSDLAEADKLIILTDVDGLLDEGGSVIPLVENVTPRFAKLARSSHCDLGTGGMVTKLDAARKVTAAGIECVIANGRTKGAILKAVNGEGIGTTFKGEIAKFAARKRWIAFSSRPKGIIRVDDGAQKALTDYNKSLLASGVFGIEGNFVRGDVVRVADAAGKEFARGVASYSSAEVAKIKGLKTSQIKDVLGYKGDDEVIHKDNLVIL